MHDNAALELLRRAVIEPVGVLTQASNLTLLVELVDPLGPTDDAAAAHSGTGHRAVYKPIRGERPLHDFAEGTLAAREVGAYLLSRAGGFDVVPPTVLREGPLGVGSLQLWVEQDPERLADPSGGLVEVLPPADLPDGWHAVVSGEDEQGAPVVVAHADDPRLRTMAVLDVVLNNADRKAAHLTVGLDGRLQGFDHGVCLHTDDKLRTVLWGWAGEPLAEPDRERLSRLLAWCAPAGTLRGGPDPLAASPSVQELSGLVTAQELTALRARIQALLDAGSLPLPPSDRYPLPWPLW